MSSFLIVSEEWPITALMHDSSPAPLHAPLHHILGFFNIFSYGNRNVSLLRYDHSLWAILVHLIHTASARVFGALGKALRAPRPPPPNVTTENE